MWQEAVVSSEYHRIVKVSVTKLTNQQKRRFEILHDKMSFSDTDIFFSPFFLYTRIIMFNKTNEPRIKITVQKLEQRIEKT